MSELIKSIGHLSKIGGAENLAFYQNTGIKFRSNDVDRMWIKSTD